MRISLVIGALVAAACCLRVETHAVESQLAGGQQLPPHLQPHQLRMQRWKLRLRPGLFRRRREMHLNFLRNGTVVATTTATTAAAAAAGAGGGSERGRHAVVFGEWHVSAGAAFWTLRNQSTTERYSAHLHINAFGEQPRMHRGVVMRDRAPDSWLPSYLFRPVIGVFSAEGEGEDTCSEEYQSKVLEKLRRRQHWMAHHHGQHHPA